MGTSRGGDVCVLVQSQHVKWWLYLPSERQKKTKRGRWVCPLPPLVTAITVINGDQNTQVTQRGLITCLVVSHDWFLLSTPIHHMQELEGTMCICKHLDLCKRLLMLTASFHYGHMVSSDKMVEVSSVLWLCLQTRVTQTCRWRRKAQQGAFCWFKC